MRRVALIHAAANAAMLWLGYYWLGTGESRALTLLWSLTVALVILCLAGATYGAAFLSFGSDKSAWRTALRNLLPLAVAALAVIVIYMLLARWADYSSTPANKIASYLTLKFRKPVRPLAILRIFNTILWLVRWVVLPVLLAPMFAAAAARGWRGFGAIGALVRRWLYWAEAPLLLLGGLWLPLKLLGWVPHVSGFGWEMTNFVARAAIAYLLFIAGGLLLAYVTAGSQPRVTEAGAPVARGD